MRAYALAAVVLLALGGGPPGKPDAGSSRRDMDPGSGRVVPWDPKLDEHEPEWDDGGIKKRLTQSDVMMEVLRKKPQFGECVRQHHQANPSQSGQLVMRWAIRTSGDVEDVTVVTEAMRSTPLAECVSRLIRELHYPPHREPHGPVELPVRF